MATFLDHLAELRARILYCAAAVIVGAIVAHYFHKTITEVLLSPLQGTELIFLSPLDPLFFILKIDFFAGLILATPVLSWSVFSFVKPAMKRSGWVIFSLLYCVAAALMLAGIMYAFLVIVPVTLQFLLSIDIPNINNMLTATSYLNFLLVQSLIIAFIFQIPLCVIAGAYIRAFSMTTLASKRRYIYVAGLIVLAIVTPTIDLFSLGMIALPACIMFEGSLLIGRLVERTRMIYG